MVSDNYGGRDLKAAILCLAFERVKRTRAWIVDNLLQVNLSKLAITEEVGLENLNYF